MINYVIGDATVPAFLNGKAAMIAHIVNDLGAWGAGFVVPLGRAFPFAEEMYRRWSTYKLNPPEETRPILPLFQLGEVQVVPVGPDVWVANMLAQSGLRWTEDEGIPLRYKALAECLKKVAKLAEERNCDVQMPRIGTGLAGGIWSRIEPLIHDAFDSTGAEVYVYDLPQRSS